MSVTIANIVSYFTPAEGRSAEVARLPIRKKLPFCDFPDSEISPPRHQNSRVTFAVHLFSCKVLLTFEDAENFAQEDDLARVKRGTTLQFLECSIQKRGNLYEYTLLTAGAGEVKFTFRTAYAKLRGIIPAAEFICKRLAGYREHLRSISADEREKLGLQLPAEKEPFPDADYFFFPYFDETNELGSLRAPDRPFYALWQLYRALREGDWGESSADEDKENWRLIVGGYLRYFRECGYDLLPLLRKYAPHWAENFSAAREAYLATEQGQKKAEERLFRITARHLAGNWYPLGGAAALKYADILMLSNYKNTPQGREEEARANAYEEEFVRALCAAANDMRAE